MEVSLAGMVVVGGASRTTSESPVLLTRRLSIWASGPHPLLKSWGRECGLWGDSVGLARALPRTYSLRDHGSVPSPL